MVEARVIHFQDRLSLAFHLSLSAPVTDKAELIYGILRISSLPGSSTFGGRRRSASSMAINDVYQYLSFINFVPLLHIYVELAKNYVPVTVIFELNSQDVLPRVVPRL